ncbi:MAG: molybdopterin converting factor subunit 1 [Armatimonadota bacterium]|nr:molybdopterin converting factor subunit 1 [bacterium]MDW8321483.1 molybdopterin converting factor subunit 1 [Armatimonadota bacterium]
MKVHVLFFGHLKDQAGEREQVVLAGSATVRDMLNTLCARHPELLQWLECTRIAVNMEYASPETPLHEGDEVALLPPMSGG